MRHNGKQTDNAFTNPNFIPVLVNLKEFTLVNLAAEYKVRPNIAVYARVENLFDEHYEEVFSYATPGRSAVGGVRVSF